MAHDRLICIFIGRRFPGSPGPLELHTRTTAAGSTLQMEVRVTDYEWRDFLGLMLNVAIYYGLGGLKEFGNAEGECWLLRFMVSGVWILNGFGYRWNLNLEMLMERKLGNS